MHSDGSEGLAVAPEVEVRRSRRRTQTVSAYRRDGKVIVMIPDRFTRAKDIGAYFGLAPTIHQSGVSSRRGRISRMGSAAMRSLLVQASITFMRFSGVDNDLRHWASRIEARRGAGRARVALARKLAIVMLSMWKTGHPYEPRPDAC